MAKPSRVRITENDGVRTMRFARAQQSSMRLDDPFETDFVYPGYLHISLAVCPSAHRTLVIGLGGGTVVKRMWRDYPWMHVDAVEIDPEIAEMARTHFAVPEDERIGVIVGDGRAFLEAAEEPYDIIIVDAFDDDRVPPHLLTEQFARIARGKLTEHGVLAYNFHGSIIGDRSKPFRSLHRTLSTAFAQLWVFPVGLSDGLGPGLHREIIVFASDARLTAEQLLARIASRVDGRVSVPRFETYGTDLYRDGVRGGDVPILSDPPKRGT